MKYSDHVIDLHMHSIHSDGTFTTSELLAMLWDKDADIFSFTDHDSVGCYYDLREGKAALYPGATLIPGVELSCSVDSSLRDMLGYGIDIDSMQGYLQEKYSLENRIRKQRKVLERIKDICREKELIFDESIDAPEGKKAEGYTVMYMELNRHPENVKRFPFIADCTRFYWDHFANTQSPFYVDETFDLPTFEEAVCVIHEAGGLAFLAHPFVYGMSDEETLQLVKKAVNAGVDGLELKHQSNKEGHVEKLRAMAAAHNLLLSGGTDFHGLNKPGIKLVTAFGNMQVEYDEIAPWIEQVRTFSPE